MVKATASTVGYAMKLILSVRSVLTRPTALIRLLLLRLVKDATITQPASHAHKPIRALNAIRRLTDLSLVQPEAAHLALRDAVTVRRLVRGNVMRAVANQDMDTMMGIRIRMGRFAYNAILDVRTAQPQVQRPPNVMCAQLDKD